MKHLTPQEAAAYVGLTVSSLAQLRHRGGGPRYLKPTARKVQYIESDLDAWLEASARTWTGEEKAA